MKISNNSTFDIEPSYELGPDVIAYVVGTEEELETNALAVFIPKFQLGMLDSIKDGMVENELSLSDIKLLNKGDKSFVNKKVKSTNYTIVRPMTMGNVGIPKYAKYEKVIVKIFDSDIKQLAFYPFSFADSGNRLDGDSYMVMIPAKGQDEDESAPITRSNAYHINMDSTKEKQRLVIGTTKKNGEKHAYSLVMDGKNGTFSISDGSKRAIILNSEEDALLFYTDEGSCIEARGDTITFDAKNVIIKAEQNFKVETKNYEMKTEDYKETSTTAKVKHKTFEQTSSKGTFKIDKEKHNGIRFTCSHATGSEFTGAMVTVNTLLAAAQFSFGGSPSLDIEIPVPPDTSMATKANQEIKKGNMDVGKGDMRVASGNMSIGSGNMNITNGSINIITGTIKVGLGIPTANADSVISALQALAASVDALGASIPRPSAASAAIAAFIPRISSSTIFGG